MNSCDHNHETGEEVRVIPIGGGGNLIVCHKHYKSEMAYRREHMKLHNSEWDFPPWETLTVYKGAE